MVALRRGSGRRVSARGVGVERTPTPHHAAPLHARTTPSVPRPLYRAGLRPRAAACAPVEREAADRVAAAHSVKLVLRLRPRRPLSRRVQLPVRVERVTDCSVGPRGRALAQAAHLRCAHVSQPSGVGRSGSWELGGVG
eukprot:7306130-Prymnesium_polylepis.1